MWWDMSKLRLMISQADPGVFEVFKDSTFPLKFVFEAGCCCQKFTHTPLSHLWWWITKMKEATRFSLALTVGDGGNEQSPHAGLQLRYEWFNHVNFSEVVFMNDSCLLCKCGLIYLHPTALFRFLHFTIFQQHWNLAAACSEVIHTSLIPTGLQLSLCYRFQQLLQFNCLFVLVLSSHSTWEIGCCLVYRDSKTTWSCVHVFVGSSKLKYFLCCWKFWHNGVTQTSRGRAWNV